MKKLFSLLVATGLIAGSMLATAAPAQADDIVDITVPRPIVAKDLVVSSKGCKTLSMSMEISIEPVAATYDWIEAFVGVWGGKVTKGKAETEILYGPGAWLANAPGEGFVPIAWCPSKMEYNVTGLGKFYVEGAVIKWWNTPYDEEYNGLTEVRTPTTTFTVKQASRVSSAKISKKRTKRTISATFSYFDVTKKAKKEWTALPKGTKGELQRSKPGAQSWTKVTTVKVGSKGRVKTTYKTTKKYDYRFFYAGNTTNAPVTSKTLKK